MTNQASNLVVSWPRVAQWVLEESSNLQTSVPWTLVPPDTYQSNASYQSVNIVTNAGSRFFRLRKNGLSVPGLRGYWGLDEGVGQTAEDGSTFGSALLFTNASWGSGRIGLGALRFTGSAAGPNASRAWVSNDNFTVLPPLGSPFSLSLWLNPDSLPVGWSGIAGNNSTGTNGWQLLLNNAGPGTNFFVLNSTGLPTSLSVTGRLLLLPGQWHQLTVTHDGAEGSIYLDSAMLARGSGPLATHDGPIYFGGGVANVDSFLGRIDDLRLYTNCLPHEQISLTGCWNFDETNGPTCLDSSIQGHSATLADSSARVPGRQGLGIDLSKSQVTIGNQDYAVLPPNGGSFSISFWLRPTAIHPGWSGLMKLGDGTIGGFEITFITDDSGRTSLHFASTNAGGTLDLLAPVPLATDNWTKFDLTFNGGIATLYANGKQIKAINGAIRGTKSPLLLGTVPGLTPFSGVIDSLKIYSRECSGAEIGPIANTMWETVMLNSNTNMTLQGHGPPGKPLTYTIVPVLTPTNGTVTLNGNTFTYSAGARKGPDAFTYTVSDGEFTSDPAIVTMSVVQPHWLSPTGGYIEPQDGSNPLHAWLAGPPDAMDAILKTNNYYDCFFYAPGEYHTRGARYLERSTANPGCKHVGTASSGTAQTVVKLVDIWSSWEESTIFSTADGNSAFADGFEIQHMVLDCNSTNLPKYVKGEPIWIRIPLKEFSFVQKLVLKWDDTWGFGRYWHSGRAKELSVQVCGHTNNVQYTNTFHYTSTGVVDTINVDMNAELLILTLDERAPGIDFYSIREIQVLGGTVSLPRATGINGAVNELSSGFSSVFLADNNSESAWASGPDNQAKISLPLESNTTVTELKMQWLCKNIPNLGRLGPASMFRIQARDTESGRYVDVPFTRALRSSEGVETCLLGTLQNPNGFTTDELILLLDAKEASMDFYSLREISLMNGSAPVRIKTPQALSSFSADLSILNAFDGADSSKWACGTQGMIGALSLMGSNIKVLDLNVIGFGTKPARECFPIFLGPIAPPTPGHFGNILVEGCTLSNPAPNNADGLTAITVAMYPPSTLTNAVVRECTVSGMTGHFTYSQGMSATHVENCLVESCDKAIYFEPYYGADYVGPVLVQSNRFVNVSYGVFLLMYPTTRFGSIYCFRNEMVLYEGGGWGICACDTCFGGPSGSIQAVTALENVIRRSDWSSDSLLGHGGIGFTDMRHAVFGNNVIPLARNNILRVRNYPLGEINGPSQHEDCDHPGPFPPGPVSYAPSLDVLPPGYKRAWFNNGDLTGSKAEVRFMSNGTDGPATDQQW